MRANAKWPLRLRPETASNNGRYRLHRSESNTVFPKAVPPNCTAADRLVTLVPRRALSSWVFAPLEVRTTRIVRPRGSASCGFRTVHANFH